MSRLIDADLLIDAINKSTLHCAESLWKRVVCDVTNNQPTAVTHCKDCKHWADKVAGCTEHVKLCTIGGYMVGKNGYCVYGEKGE